MLNKGKYKVTSTVIDVTGSYITEINYFNDLANVDEHIEELSTPIGYNPLADQDLTEKLESKGDYLEICKVFKVHNKHLGKIVINATQLED